jgi:DNA-binding beta-propeller fold protein YncE
MLKKLCAALAWAGVVCVVALIAAVSVSGAPGSPPSAAWRSPFDVAFSPDGKLLAASDHTAGAVAILDAGARKVLRQVPLKGRPTGLAWAPDGRLFVAELGAGSVAEVDAAAGKVVRHLAVGPRPVPVAVAAKHKLLLVGNSGLHNVSVVDLASGKERKRIPVVRRPHAIAVTRDESLAVVANFLPVGDATDANHSSALSFLDLKRLECVKTVRLPGGSTMVRDVAVSPDGKWAYAVHTLGRFTLPTTQLDRGWVNTNAMSVIDLTRREHYATVLLDRLTEGAADPWGAVVSQDGKTLWTTLSGVHQVGRVDLEKLHLLMAGKPLPPEKPDDHRFRGPRHISDIWLEIKKDAAKRAMLANDLAALYGAGLLIRTKVEGNGLRGVDVSPDGKRLAVASYFTGRVLLLDADTEKLARAAALGKQPEMTEVRRGETIFHDGTYSFQHWLSCATCHPDARVDGLNWDLLNDGIGNPKNSRSLMWSHKTPPVMSRGVRASMGVASLSGFRFILFREPEPDEVEAVKAYLRSLEPEQSPYRLANGQLSDKAKEGHKIFEDRKAGCVKCHPAPLYTDMKMYNVGTRGELDRTDMFDTSTLAELWRTGPYLHDGAAKDLHEVFTKFNKKDQHGKTSHLSKDQLDALVEYLLSL